MHASIPVTHGHGAYYVPSRMVKLCLEPCSGGYRRGLIGYRRGFPHSQSPLHHAVYEFSNQNYTVKFKECSVLLYVSACNRVEQGQFKFSKTPAFPASFPSYHAVYEFSTQNFTVKP